MGLSRGQFERAIRLVTGRRRRAYRRCHCRRAGKRANPVSDAHELRAGLVAELSRHGWVTPEWQEAFGTVPRHLFLRRFFTLTTDQSQYEAINYNHPDWLKLVYRNAVWPTQLDGDDTRWDHARAHGPVTGTPTCSSTQPSLMAVMLKALDVCEGH